MLPSKRPRAAAADSWRLACTGGGRAAPTAVGRAPVGVMGAVALAPGALGRPTAVAGFGAPGRAAPTGEASAAGGDLRPGGAAPPLLHGRATPAGRAAPPLPHLAVGGGAERAAPPPTLPGRAAAVLAGAPTAVSVRRGPVAACWGRLVNAAVGARASGPRAARKGGDLGCCDRAAPTAEDPGVIGAFAIGSLAVGCALPTAAVFEAGTIDRAAACGRDGGGPLAEDGAISPTDFGNEGNGGADCGRRAPTGTAPLAG